MDAFYVMHHMQEFIRDQQNLRMPSQKSQSHVHTWGQDLANAPDERLRLEFYRIQQNLASIIIREVIPTDGIFFGGIPNRAEVDDRLELQCDHRPFNKLGGILIERPPRKSK